MRHTAQDEILVTTVVVKAPAGRVSSEWQHQVVMQAVLAGMAAGTTGLQQPDRWNQYRYGGAPRRRREFPRVIWLLLSLLLLAGAVFFLYLAVK